MKNKYTIFGSILTVVFLFSMCNIMKSSPGKLFKIKEAWYQPWMFNKKEKGTDIVLEMLNVKQGVVFDSIVFRGLKIQVFIEKKGDILQLKSTINADVSVLQFDKQKTNESDQLIYHYNGKRGTVALTSIKARETKYY
jgi:hypothetical protein